MDAAQKAEPTTDRIDDALLDDLRAIVAGPDRERMRLLETRIAEVEHRTGDHEALVAAVSPILGDAIRRQVREDRDEMIESLYPIIGQLIARAVAEAIRDLARTIDRRMRTSFSPALFLRRLRARARGVSGAELALRDALPFQVTELFLVHRESGLLLLYLSREQPHPSDAEDNSDLVSSMLTAIQDFAQDAFGQGQQGGLDEIQYGNRRILIEASQHVYLAVVVDGVEPAGFRAKIRERGSEVEIAYLEALEHYNGDASQFSSVRPALADLLGEGSSENQPAGLSPNQKRIAVGLAVSAYALPWRRLFGWCNLGAQCAETTGLCCRRNSNARANRHINDCANGYDSRHRDTYADGHSDGHSLADSDTFADAGAGSDAGSDGDANGRTTAVRAGDCGR